MPVISVLMSIYNETEAELRSAVDSVLNQSYKNFELIIIDDSQGNPLLYDIVSSYAKQDERIRLFKNSENIGLAESMNKAASFAKGDYYLRMDADDICDLTRFEKQVDVISNGDYDIVCSSYYFIDQFGKLIDKTVEWFDSYSLGRILPYRNVIHHPTVIMRAKTFKKMNGYRNFKCAQDYDLWFRMMKANCKFYMMRDKLLYYRIRPESTTLKQKYKQKSTLEYIRLIHNDRGKNKENRYNYIEYLQFLDSKGVDNPVVTSDYLCNMELYNEAKKDITNLHFFQGIRKLLYVILRSRYYRPNLTRFFLYHAQTKILKIRYRFVERFKII